MLLNGGSTEDLGFARFMLVRDLLGKMADEDLEGASGLSFGPLSAGFATACLFPPLSLPLSPPSAFRGAVYLLASAEKEALDNGAECGGTTSSVTVGREIRELFISDVNVLPVTSFTGVDLGSSRCSALLWLDAGVETANLFIDVFGWTPSESDLRDRFRVDDGGGGDIILGDRGHCCEASIGRALCADSVLADSTTPSMLGG